MGELPIVPERLGALVRQPIVYRGENVVTLALVDELHRRPDGTAKRNFRANKQHLIRDEDYFSVPYSEWSGLAERTKFVLSATGGHGRKGHMVFLAKSGYLMLVKSFNDELAWQVQRTLVNNYFVAESARALDERQAKVLRDAFLPVFEAARAENIETKTEVKGLRSEFNEFRDETREALNSVVPRKHPTNRTKRRHIRSMQRRDIVNCPCCGTESIIDQFGQPLESLQWDHWYARHRRGIHEVWCVCVKCNQALKEPEFKSRQRAKYETHQQFVRELADDERPDQLLLFDEIKENP